MRVLIAGASGFLGSRLREHLIRAGHDVTALVRRAPGPGQARWDPYSAELDPALVEGADVVVNLAGSPTLGNPHSGKWADQLRTSRVTTTRVLADAIAASSRKPAFLAGNGISFYGDHGDEPLPETADSRGDAFLTGVTHDWQAATRPAGDAGARVCILRTSPVMDRASAPKPPWVIPVMRPLPSSAMAASGSTSRNSGERASRSTQSLRVRVIRLASSMRRAVEATRCSASC